MQLISFTHAGKASYGVVDGNRVFDLGARFGAEAPTLKALLCLAAWRDRVDAVLTGDTLPLDALALLPVIPDPGVIACVGHNYEAHRIETQRDPTAFPSIFFRHAESLRGAGSALLRPRESTQFDYEGEVAVVMGRAGRRIPQADAWQYVAGLSCFNDGSIRDWQHHTRQFGPGKNFAGTAGFGPALVTLDALPVDRVLALSTFVNGERVQHAQTDQMIFPIPTLIAYLSTFMTLQPGDVIATGTPGGVGVKRTPPLWLKPGDMVEVRVSSVGSLMNRVEDEPNA